ncbi:PREDICTED: proline-rich receptor-like protein kinase PERK2 [Cercocebus atys]|uniref:proline-rich receptor-like protein kinase PERK2 n=1 Tax=Cercocebus atys TaxID=9531 RepID=UPI0005F55F0C|nr:PREDICTED: proline-rich receptor-like protein kinase PERK2 [Cercocebus atys]
MVMGVKVAGGGHGAAAAEPGEEAAGARVFLGARPWAGRLSLPPTGALVPAAASPPPPRCLVPFLSKQWCPLRGGSWRLLSTSALLDPPLLLPPLLPRGEGLNLLPKAPSSLGKSAVLCREDCPSLLQGLLPSGSHPPHPILRPPRQPSPSPEEPLSSSP